MSKLRNPAAQCLEKLDLDSGIDDMILAADHMGDIEIDIVDDRPPRVKICTILAHQNRIGERGGIDMLGAADEIHPFDVAPIELEAPMRAASFGFEPLAVFLAELERGAVIDGRCVP